MKKLSMTLSSPTVALTDGTGTLTASVNNASTEAERVILGAFASGPAAGIAVPAEFAAVGEPLRTIPPGATVQYEVAFDGRKAEPGTYPVKLIPYSADEAPEEYAALGHVVQVEVPKAADAPAPARFPWWIVAIAAGVVLIGAGVATWALTRGEATPSPTPVPVALTSFTPAEGPIEGGTVVQLLGRFDEPTVVTVGDMQVEAVRVSDTEFTFTTPAVAAAGQIPMLVESGGERLGVAIFEYTAPVPPDDGGGVCDRFPWICDDLAFPLEVFVPGEIIGPTEISEFDPEDLGVEQLTQ